jgi:hypothetical protein
MFSYFTLQDDCLNDHQIDLLLRNSYQIITKQINKNTLYIKCHDNLESLKCMLKLNNQDCTQAKEISESEFNLENQGFEIIDKSELEAKELIKNFKLSYSPDRENAERIPEGSFCSPKFSQLTRSRFFSFNFSQDGKISEKCLIFQFITDKSFFVKFTFYSLIFVLLVNLIEVLLYRCRFK